MFDIDINGVKNTLKNTAEDFQLTFRYTSA